MSGLSSGEVARIIGMAGLLGLSGFFSGSETALFSLRRSEIDELGRRHPRRARLILSLLRRPDELLVSILFGNLVVNVLYFSLGAHAASMLGGRTGAAVAAGSFVALLLFGEMLPKAVAAGSPRAAARLVALPLWTFFATIGRLAVRGARPILRTVNALAGRRRGPEALGQEELKMLVDLAEGAGTISGLEADMLAGVVTLSEVRVRELMTPRVDALFVPVSARPEEALKELAKRDIRCAPVFDWGIDNVIGLVEAGDLLAARNKEPSGLAGEEAASAAGGVRPFVREVAFVPEGARAAAALERFRDEGLSFAVVVDEYGGASGVLTLEDLAEGALGEAVLAAAPGGLPAVRRDELTGAYILSGDLSVRDWAALFGVKAEPGQFETLGGLVVSLLGRVPREGDVVRLGNLRFTVTAMRGRRVEEVSLELEGPPEPPGGEEDG